MHYVGVRLDRASTRILGMHLAGLLALSGPENCGPHMLQAPLGLRMLQACMLRPMCAIGPAWAMHATGPLVPAGLCAMGCFILGFANLIFTAIGPIRCAKTQQTSTI